jgi:hypothetical protein
MSREAKMAAAPKYMAVQGAAVIMAGLLSALGVFGFIPGITSHVDQLVWTGPRSPASLFGVFAVSGLQNMVHIVLGLIGVAAARTYAGSRAYLLGSGLLYLVLCSYGWLAGTGSDARVLPLNQADNWLHLGLGVVSVLLAVTLAGQHDPTKRRPRQFRARSTAH